MACHGEVEIIQGAQNIAGNYTTVTANFYCVRDSGYAYSGYTTYAWCVLDGVGQTITVSGFDISASNPKILIGSITKNIYHNSDGTKTVSASFSWDSQNSYVGIITGSASKVLTTIPRTSSVSCNSFNIGDATTIVISRASSSFTHTVTWAFGNASGTIATKTTQTTIGTTIPAASLYAQIPNAKSGTGTITCKTYSGDNLIGTSTCNFTAYAKEADCIPSISATITDINDATIALTGSSTKFIKGFSTSKVVASATAKNSATISNYKITAGTGDGRTSNTATTNFIGINSNSITVTATDSRGYSKSVNYTLDWIEYVKLAFTSITIQRPESTADKANMTIKGNYFNNSFGSVSNSLILKYRYKESGGTYSEWITLTHTITDNTFTYTELLENLDHNKEYLFEFMIDDQLMIVYSEEIILTKGIPVLRVGKDYLQINGKAIFDIVYPIGSIYTSVNSTNPSSLFGGTWVQIKDTFLLACGTTYSNGDTGGNASATSSKATGNTGSTKLTISQMPAHSHTFKSIPTTDTQTWQAPNQVFTYKYVKGTNYTMTTTETGGGTGHTHTLNSHSHTVDTMPPYLAVYVWKRTA